MQFLSSSSSFSRQTREQDEGRYASGNLLLWIAVIAVLLGLNFASWSFCMWVFGQPEYPMNYRILTRLEKLDPIRGFIATNAPRGKFYTAKELYSKMYPLTPTEMKAYNGILKRLYLKNFKERKDVTYLAGDFVVKTARRLTKEDVFTSGLVIRARARNFPDAFVDLVLPAEKIPDDLPAPGDELKIEESSTCAAVLNVDRRENEVMVFTAVPLVADPLEPFDLGGQKTISVSPQKWLNLDRNRWPVSLDKTGGAADQAPASPGKQASETVSHKAENKPGSPKGDEAEKSEKSGDGSDPRPE